MTNPRYGRAAAACLRISAETFGWRAWAAARGTPNRSSAAEPVVVRQRQAEPDRPAVVLHEEAVPIDVRQLREAVDDPGDVVEGVVERAVTR